MPHSPEEKKRAIARLRRIRGQAEALERQIDQGADCGSVLQQLAAMRGAVNGLMADVLEGHLHESFGPAVTQGAETQAALSQQKSIEEIARLVRSYLK